MEKAQTASVENLEQTHGAESAVEITLGARATDECVEVVYGPQLEEVPPTVRLESYVLFGFDPGAAKFDSRDVKRALKNIAGTPELQEKSALLRYQNLSLDAANLRGQFDIGDNGSLISEKTTQHPVHRALNQRPDFVGACTPGKHASNAESQRLLGMFYPNGKQVGYEKKINQAKAICATCDARQQCLDFAMAQPSSKDQGVMGGTSDGERRRARKIARRDGEDAAQKYLTAIVEKITY